MKSLLENKFAPLTFSWGFLNAPIDNISEALFSWVKEHQKTVKLSWAKSNLEGALRFLEPLTTLRRREILISTNSSWVAYFDNLVQGGDPVGPMSYLAQILKCRTLAVTCVPHKISDRQKGEVSTFGAVQFQLFGPNPTDFLNFERSISVLNDGGRWVFDTGGKVQTFEKIEQYKKRKITDRFTPELLAMYCSELGLDIFNSDFYGPDIVGLTVLDPLPEGHFALSLSEARIRIDL